MGGDEEGKRPLETDDGLRLEDGDEDALRCEGEVGPGEVEEGLEGEGISRGKDRAEAK